MDTFQGGGASNVLDHATCVVFVELLLFEFAVWLTADGGGGGLVWFDSTICILLTADGGGGLVWFGSTVCVVFVGLLVFDSAVWLMVVVGVVVVVVVGASEIFMGYAEVLVVRN